MEPIPRGKGYSRFHYQENIQFCRQARGSLFELVDHLSVLLNEAVLSKDDFEMLRAEIFRVVRMLNGYVKYLQKRKRENA